MKAKGINISRLCRDAIDSCLKLSAGDYEMLKDEQASIENQLQTLTLEKKLVLSRLQEMEAEDSLLMYREGKLEKWKSNYVHQIKNKTIDWQLQKDLFRFVTIEETKKYITEKLRSEGLI